MIDTFETFNWLGEPTKVAFVLVPSMAFVDLDIDVEKVEVEEVA